MTTEPLDYYARIGAHLFPTLPGSKAPTGIVASFAHGHSADPAQWRAWQTETPNCNFGIVAGPSDLIICDVDVKAGRDEAWAAWCDLCASWSIPVAMPQVQSARGGWHVLFRVPDGVDSADLRQPDAIKGIVNVRAGKGYTIAAGSYYDGSAKGEESGYYTLLADVDPYPAPAALVEHCTRRAVAEVIAPPVELDRNDIAEMLQWMATRDAFADYESWLQSGMAIRAYADDIDLWRICHNDTVTPDVEQTKWASFATVTTDRSVTINSLLHRAHKMGWKGSVRKSTDAMFGTVAKLAAAAGASLPTVREINGMPMLRGQAMIAELGGPVLAAFNDAQHLSPDTSAPTLPETMRDHELYDATNRAIGHVFAAVKSDGAALRNANTLNALAVVAHVHRQTFDAVTAALTARVPSYPEGKITTAVKQFEIRVSRELRAGQGFQVDRNGRPDADNSDNVAALLALVGLRVRWNAFLQRKEMSRGDDEWTAVDDAEIDRLYTIAHATDYDFRVSVDMLRRATNTLARENTFDPLLDRINRLEATWDGVPRLSTWLARACGTPCDRYHQAVARNLVGGMVKRARKPGAKHDEVVLFLDSTQGTGKSSMCKILALEPEWHTDSFRFEGSPQNTIPQLAGKWVIELSDLAGYGRRDVEHVKSFISTEVDSFTPKFQGDVSHRPRRCIFIGTSNDTAPLVDTTGNRRFLPVQLDREIDLEWLRANIDQIVAEAAALETKGETFAIPRELWAVAGEQQEAARTERGYEIALQTWFPMDGQANVYVTAHDLQQLIRSVDPTGLKGYAETMKRLGFVRRTWRPGAGAPSVRIWARGDMTMAVQCVVSEITGRPRPAFGPAVTAVTAETGHGLEAMESLH
ncbi:MAG TPA: VapE domain-containing protein [Pseudolabrys sp.]|nr:VapE domain-containing protein [Pseudolabrys sp.]